MVAAKRLKLDEVSAVQLPEHGDIEVLGFMVWYSLGEQLVHRDTLREMLEEAGLEKGFMPGEIRGPDAFRRATKDVECKKGGENDKVTHRFLVREVTSGPKMIQRNIVREIVNGRANNLEYETREAILILDRENNDQFRYTALTDEGRELAERAMENYDTYMDHYDSNALRSTIITCLKTMSPVTLKRTGGVYFVPAEYQERLRCLIDFIKMLERGEAQLIPLINNNESLEMVRQATIKQVSNAFDRLKDVHEDEDATSSDIGRAIEDTEQAFQVLKDYKQLLYGDLEHLDRSQLQIQKLLNDLKSRKKTRRSKTVQRSLLI